MSIFTTNNITVFNDDNLRIVKRVSLQTLIVEFDDTNYIVDANSLESIEDEIKSNIKNYVEEHNNYDRRKLRSIVLQVLKNRACYILKNNM